MFHDLIALNWINHRLKTIFINHPCTRGIINKFLTMGDGADHLSPRWVGVLRLLMTLFLRIAPLMSWSIIVMALNRNKLDDVIFTFYLHQEFIALIFACGLYFHQVWFLKNRDQVGFDRCEPPSVQPYFSWPHQFALTGGGENVLQYVVYVGTTFVWCQQSDWLFALCFGFEASNITIFTNYEKTEHTIRCPMPIYLLQ